MKQIHKLLLSLLFLLSFHVKIQGKVQISSDLFEVLQRKSNLNDPENRVIVAFETKSDPSENLQKVPLQFLKADELRAALGNLVVNEMKAENWELEQKLLEFVDKSQIVRRLPIGNAFILEGLDLLQANKISQLNRTVLLALSRFTPNGGANYRNWNLKTDEPLSKCVLNTGPAKLPFNEPVEDIEEWKTPGCDPLHKASCQPNIPWNIQRIKTPQTWSKGYKGKGIIYGVIDTGVSYKHPALIENYRGRKADGTYDHNYAWYDAVRTEPKFFGRDRKKDLKLDQLEEKINRESQYARLYKTTGNLKKAKDFEIEEGDEEGEEEEDSGYEGDVSSDDYDDENSENSDNSDNSDSGYKIDNNYSNDVEDECDFEMETMTKVNAVVDKCDYGVNEPCDAGGHGTHVASTAIGGYGLGTAPEAQWMACRSIASNIGREEDSLACLNFFLAPHDLNGENPRPDLRPHVIGNSYGWESWAEVTGAGIDLAVKRLESAGTVMVFAAGNSGPSCGTVHSAFSFTVGATTEQGSLAQFSSRGPWTISPLWINRPHDPSKPLMIKPDISAPGQAIIGAYGSRHMSKMSGTSMAAPHVAGSISLILQACPHLIGKPAEVQRLLEKTARPLVVPFGVNPCGRDNFTSIPNNFFGFGELDIEAAINSCQLSNDKESKDLNVNLANTATENENVNNH